MVERLLIFYYISVFDPKRYCFKPKLTYLLLNFTQILSDFQCGGYNVKKTKKKVTQQNERNFSCLSDLIDQMAQNCKFILEIWLFNHISQLSSDGCAVQGIVHSMIAVLQQRIFRIRTFALGFPRDGQEQMSRDKLLCPGTSRDKMNCPGTK